MKMTRYTGVTRLLKTPFEAGGKLYPYRYDSDIPDRLNTSYRVVETMDSEMLTDAQLRQMLRSSRMQRLFADLDKPDGYPLMWITVHPEERNDSGSSGSGGGGGRKVRLEKGPDLQMELRPPQIERTAPDVKLPEPKIRPPEPRDIGRDDGPDVF